jgi:hypothetical protein
MRQHVLNFQARPHRLQLQRRNYHLPSCFGQPVIELQASTPRSPELVSDELHLLHRG